jgi:hypothetical protein
MPPPCRAGGLIYIVDHETYAVLDKYPIRRILFCAAGDPEMTSLGWTMLETEPSSRGDGSDGGPAERFECRVFDFPAQDKTQLALAQIAASFGKIDGASAGGNSAANALRYTFEAAIAVAEEDPQKGGFSQCPVSKGSFKLRSATSKLHFTLTITQTSKQSLVIDQGFGLLIGKTLAISAAQTPELRGQAFQPMMMISSSKVRALA